VGSRRWRLVGLAAGAAFAGTVWLANWLVGRYGAVPVGFGLIAPAGVYAAGLAFTLRDIVQRLLGRWVVLACIAVGAGLAWWVSDIRRIAIASALAFLASELIDFVVYTPLWRKMWLRAVLASNLVGLTVDSLIFLWIAFGSLTFFWGQMVGKLWVTLGTVAILACARLLYKWYF